MTTLPTTAPASIVHVLPADLARGAQLFARTLRDRLDGHPDRHRTLALFASGPGELRPDVALGVPSGRARRVGLQPRAMTTLRRELAHLDADVVVAHGGETLKYAVLARPLGSALVYTKTGVSSGSLQGRVHAGLYRFLAGRAALVAAVSEESAAEAVHLLGVPAARVHLIVNGRDPDVYRPAPAGRRSSVPRLVFVGHLNRTKDPERFLEVVRRVRAQGLTVDAAIVGDGPLLDTVATSPASAGVEVLGRRGDVPDLLRSADVVVFPGRPEGEGMPGVFIEAGLCGVPVVATDVPGASTVIDHGVTGFVVPVDDLDALVRAVTAIVADPDLRDRMGLAARRRCADRWSLDTVAARWQAAFDHVLGRRPALTSPA